MYCAITLSDETTTFQTQKQADAFMDQLDVEKKFYEVQYADGARWEFGPNQHSIKLNNL